MGITKGVLENEVKRVINEWIHWYYAARPHQVLGYLSPREYRVKQSCQVA